MAKTHLREHGECINLQKLFWMTSRDFSPKWGVSFPAYLNTTFKLRRSTPCLRTEGGGGPNSGNSAIFMDGAKSSNCPTCGHRMILIKDVPGLGALPTLRMPRMWGAIHGN